MPLAEATGALREIEAALTGMDEAEVEAALDLIAQARRIVAHGCGRERLQVGGFAMRLHHLGLSVAMQGDMAAPPIAAGDLLVCSAGPGELATVTALTQIAREAGADVLFLTAEPKTASAHLATAILTIPARTMARDETANASAVLPMGSVYEGALFVLFEVMVARLKARLGISAEAMRANHTNLE